MLLALAGDDPAESRLRELLATPLTDDADLAEALALLRSSPSMAAARTEMTRWAEAARAELARLPQVVSGPVAEAATYALSALCDAVTTRTG